MNKRLLLDKIGNKFIVVLADMGNLPYRATLGEDEETGEVILPMPTEAYGDHAEIGDVMSFKKPSKYKIEMTNLSCKYVKKTAFLREYNSICRQITSIKHPLNRLILDCNGEHYLLKYRV